MRERKGVGWVGGSWEELGKGNHNLIKMYGKYYILKMEVLSFYQRFNLNLSLSLSPTRFLCV